MGEFEGAYLTVIKRFEFAEPVFQPEKLAKSIFSWLPFDHRENYTFLGDFRQIKFLIDHNKTIKIGGIGTMKPIRNPYALEELFWLPFKPNEQVVKLGIRPELPMFPFIITPEIKIFVRRNWLETILGSIITNNRVYLEMLIYPPGIITVRLNLFIQSKEASLDLSGLIRLYDQLNTMPLITVSKEKVYKRYNGVFNVFKSLANQVASCILSSGSKRKEFPGYYVVFTLLGESTKLIKHSDTLAKILKSSKSLKLDSHSSELKGKYKDDILVVGRRASIIYVDAGIREKHHKQYKLNISEGRRCFRNNFTNSVEFAYITEALIQIYKRRFNDILNEIEKLPLSTTVETVIKKYATRGVLDPCAYGTLKNEILEVPDRLGESRKDNFWKSVYVKVALGLGLSKNLEELKITTEKVYTEAVKYRSQYKERISNLSKNINNAIDRVLKLINAVKQISS
jgi:hypothetical protein